MTKKMLNSILRTAIAVLATSLSAILFYFGTNWHSWCPSNDLGFLIVVALFIGCMILLLTGIYYISPMFWIAVFSLFENMVYPYHTEENISHTRRRIKYLRRRYLW